MASMELCRLFVVLIGNLTKSIIILDPLQILAKLSHEYDDGEVEHVTPSIRSPRRPVLPAYWRSRRRLVAADADPIYGRLDGRR
jgi:hypothetical protein